ncbi:MAG: hypothetical protein LQ341_003174 [Variospora aurantia]|nr:MAG: hypothetical protein LQ341_003174 [Variospora aurantia]
MRRVKIFAGSSHPGLVDAICERLGTQPAKCDLRKFSNGETSVSIETSIRDQDVFIVQSGSPKVNDTVMELLIMVAACKGGSAKSITGIRSLVLIGKPQAPPAQGFFGKPVDNLHAEPLIARWIRNHVSGWKEAVVVSKNPGGSKRVTSLADALKLNFGIITTDRRRMTMGGSSFLDTSGFLDRMGDATYEVNHLQRSEMQAEASLDPTIDIEQPRDSSILPNSRVNGATDGSPPLSSMPLRQVTGANSSPHARTVDAQQPQHVRTPPIPRSVSLEDPISEQDSADEYTDQRATEVITGRLVQGHLVDDDDPSPILSTMSGSVATLPGDSVGPPQFDDQDPMTSSVMSHLSTVTSHNTLAGAHAAGESEDEEEKFKNPELEHTITLVGNVKDRTVFIMDDLIDQCGSWIAAAETVVKRGGAKKVYCIATHGLFGYDSLEQMEECECIDFIVVTNTYPISLDRIRSSRKLVILDVSNLLSEAIRRNHYGESISQLFQHYQD